MEDVTPVEIPLPNGLYEEPARLPSRSRRLSDQLVSAIGDGKGQVDADAFAKAIEELGDYIVEAKDGGGGGGPGPGDVIKKVRGNTWLIGLLVLLFGSGGIVTNYYITKQQAEDNAAAIKSHGEEPMHRQAGQRVDKIESDLRDVKADVGDIKEGQKAVAEGVQQLKREAQTEKQRRLERENAELRRKLRER